MKRVRHNGKTLLMTTLAIGCMALVLLWPQWRDELRAQDYDEDGVKRGVTIASTAFATASGAAWTVAELCAAGIITVGCSLPSGLIAALTATAAGAGALFVAIDPADPNFMVIPVPTPAPFTLVIAGKGTELTQAEADALNALLSNEAEMVGLLRAMVTAVNRAQGALEAGDTFWEAKQREALSEFQSELGQVYKDEAALREALVDLLERNNFPQVTITPDQIFDLQTTLAETGWPPELESFLLEIGNDEATIEELRLLVSTQDVNGAAGDFPSSLAKPELLSALREAGEALAPPPLKGE